MTEDVAPEPIAIIWSADARVDLRAIERDTAVQILHCIHRYLASRLGDVKKLKPPGTGFRLRCGDHRVFFDFKDEATTEVIGVRNRRDAYQSPDQRLLRSSISEHSAVHKLILGNNWNAPRHSSPS